MATMDDQSLIDSVRSPQLISDKLLQFLSEVYFGPLYDNGTVGERIGTYLYFLNPDDPLYRVTSKIIIRQLLLIYQRANNIQFQDKDGCTTGENSDTQIRNYFGDEFDKFHQKYVDHQHKYGEILGQPIKFEFDGSSTGVPNTTRVWRFHSSRWWIPTTFSFAITSSIANDNIESYEIEEDGEYDHFDEINDNLINTLRMSLHLMDNHPEVTDAATPFKTITRTPIKPVGKE